MDTNNMLTECDMYRVILVLYQHLVRLTKVLLCKYVSFETDIGYTCVATSYIVARNVSTNSKYILVV